MRRVETVLGLIFLVLIGWIIYSGYTKFPSLKAFIDWLWRSLKNLLTNGAGGEPTAFSFGGGGGSKPFPDLADVTANKPAAEITIGARAGADGSLVWEQ